MYDIANAILIILCCVFLYRKFCYKSKLKVVKTPKIPTTEEIRRQHKKERRMRKIKRRFRIPYWGNAKIIKYDKTAPYIESAWNEIQKPKKKP